MSIDERMKQAVQQAKLKGKAHTLRPMYALRLTRKGMRFVGEQKLRRLAARFEAQREAERRGT